MMQNKGKYYITTAIAYTSGKPHIGNNYEIVLADSIARYQRKDGYDVFFQTGTDEHGQKIEMKAADAGVTPKEFVTCSIFLMISLFEQRMRFMRNRYKRFLNACTNKVIFIRAHMKECIVRRVNHFGQNHS